MANQKRDESAKQRPMPARDAKTEQRAKENLREQTKTEVEERPYLDTEGGE